MNGIDVQALRDDIARTVMGWHTVEMPWAYDGRAMHWHDADRLPRLTVHSWRPDEDDAQCMQVVQRMLDLDFRLHLECSRSHCRARFQGEAGGNAWVEHADRRVALLRAALAALAARQGP